MSTPARIEEDRSIASNAIVQQSSAVYHYKVRRRISPQAGKALEKLGHAIEYLADEVVQEGGPLSGENPQLQAIRILMGLNRKIYFECPSVPTLGQRAHAFFLSQRERLWKRLVKDVPNKCERPHNT